VLSTIVKLSICVSSISAPQFPEATSAAAVQ
jgi:hypothetical protein